MLELRRHKEQATLIPFLMAGDPSLEVSEQMAIALLEEGVGALEIGLPFSDALADGPVIQRAAERALKRNVDLDSLLQMTGRVSRLFPRVPLILFTYLNPLLAYGLRRYARRARESGVSATLTVDLPPEEAESYLRVHRDEGLKTVFLVSPTTSQERIALISQASTGFIYVVSRLGVTGTHASAAAGLDDYVRRIRSVTDQPLAVGFGISNEDQARRVARVADGVVVGSAFVRLVEEVEAPLLIDEVRGLARVLMRGIKGT